VIYDDLRAAVARAAVMVVRDLIVSEFLLDIAAGRSALRAVRHPLGFDCLPVLRDGDEGVCVHVWPERSATGRLTTSPFHCHSWDLLSHVLYGEVGNQRVDITPGTGYRVFEARSSSGGRDELVETARTVDARGLEPDIWRTGQTYALQAGAFHASVVRDGAAAATVALGKQQPGRPDFTLGDLHLTSHVVHREQLSIEETATLAQQLITRLALTSLNSPAYAAATTC
jgi:hypothetical protein